MAPAWTTGPKADRQIPEQAKALGISEQEVARCVMLQETVNREFMPVADAAEAMLFCAAFPRNGMTGRPFIVSHGWFMH